MLNVAQNSLFAHYAFTPTARLKDRSANAKDLLASQLSPTYQSDCQWPGAECAVFSAQQLSSGTGQYFVMPSINPGLMSVTNGFSICTWLVYDAYDQYARIFDFGLGAENNNVLMALAGTSLSVYFNYRSGISTEILSSPNPIVIGTWRHVCVINSNKLWKWYDDGILSAELTANNLLQQTDLTSNFLGRSNWGQDAMFRGKLDEFRIYGKALTSQEVAAIYTYQGLLRLSARLAAERRVGFELQHRFY